MRRSHVAAVAMTVLALVATVPAVHIVPAAAAVAECATSAPARPAAGAVSAGSAVARGLFLTYADSDTVLEGGTVIPPDVASPLAQTSVDRTGLGAALGSPFYSPYSDAAGVLNAFAGTELPVDGVSEPSRAKVGGRPPQEQSLTIGGGACARLAPGPIAEAAANAANAAPYIAVRLGEVKSLTAPKDGGTQASSLVVLTDVEIATVRIEQVVLRASALADGREGAATASSLVSGLSIAGQRYAFDAAGLDPIGAAPDASALSAAGVEFLPGGRLERSAAGGASTAVATGPILRIISPDGRTFTVVLGQARANAEYERIDR